MHWYEDPAELKRVRKSLGLTQAQLAERAGVKAWVIADVELGRRSFSEDVREPIWEALSERRREEKKSTDALAKKSGMTLAALKNIGPDTVSDSMTLLYRLRLQQEQIEALKMHIKAIEEQNQGLREWLEAEEKAALAHEKAVESK